jgi:hypothetical protein
MQAAIHTSAGQQWAAAVWVFNHVLQRVADVLARQGHVGLAAQLISAKNSQAPRISEFRLSDLSVQDRIFFVEGLRMAHQRYLAEGPAGWNMPDFYPVFMERFAALLQLADSENVQYITGSGPTLYSSTAAYSVRRTASGQCSGQRGNIPEKVG